MTAKRTPQNQKLPKGAKTSRSKKNFKDVRTQAVLSDKKRRERQHFSLTDIDHFNDLLTFFNENYFKAIELKNIQGENWSTRHYVTPPRNMLEAYLDTNLVIGMRFNTLTRVLVGDIDHLSPYHPCIDEAEYRRLLGVLEDIGLVGYEVIQSSNSGGIHLYLPLSTLVPSWLAAHALTVILQNAGFTLAKGKLELFPNRKGYSPEGVTCFHGIRLPLQPDTGSFVLDPFDFCPVHNDLKTFVSALHHHAQRQDMETFERTMKAAYEDFHVDQKTGKVRRNFKTGVSFHDDLLARILPGWTGDAQTNDLVFEAVKYSYVFKHLDGEELVRETAAWLRTLPGYEEYCGHKHNLERRVQDWLKSTKNLGYYPYTGEYRPRNGANYGDTVQATRAAQPEDGRSHNAANTQRQQAAEQRLAATVRVIRQRIRQGAMTVPQTITSWVTQLSATAKELSGKGFSTQFLYRCKGLLGHLKAFTARLMRITSKEADPVEPQVPKYTPLQPAEPAATPVTKQHAEECTPVLKTPEPAPELPLLAIFEQKNHGQIPETQVPPAITGYLPHNEGWEALSSPAVDAVPPPPDLSLPAPQLTSCDFRYRLGEKVRFQHESVDGWRKGTIIHIHRQSGYFVNCLIKFNTFVKRSSYTPGEWVERTVKLFNVNWIKPLVSEPS
jgi:hypothetical protein